MNEEQIIELLNRYKAGTLSAEESAKLETWYLEHTAGSDAEISYQRLEAISQKMRNELPVKYNNTPVRLISRIAAAAAILIIAGIGFYFYNRTGQKLNSNTAYANDIQAPKGNKAYLTLADGSRISLTDAANGKLADQSGIEIVKAADGQLHYQVSGHASANGKPAYNTVETPVGGQHRISLPDGTLVWLNSASSLRFPASFTAMKDRRVELSGQAYFEVKKDKTHPFIVKTAKQELLVLGTHFDVNAYTNENLTKTTLLEGSVRITLPSLRGGTTKQPQTKEIILKPGQLSAIGNGEITVNRANISQELAWKDGYFKFDGENIESIMRKLSRWYDIEVAYEGKVTDEVYYGKISRFKEISGVLRMLEKAQGVHFKVEGRRVMVLQ